ARARQGAGDLLRRDPLQPVDAEAALRHRAVRAHVARRPVRLPLAIGRPGLLEPHRPRPLRLAPDLANLVSKRAARRRLSHIGVPRFELGTSPTRTERATRLRHTPGRL